MPLFVSVLFCVRSLSFRRPLMVNRSSENRLPRQIEHGFGKKYDKQHMGKHDGVDVFGPADGQGAPCHFDDGDGEMDEDADCQQDFEDEERTE